jgi:hypothetical protein
MFQRRKLEEVFHEHTLICEVDMETVLEAYSCFAVTFREKEQRYVFNGRKPRTKDATCPETSGILDFSNFPVMETLAEGDSNPMTQQTASSECRAIQCWRDNVTVPDVTEQSHIDTVSTLAASFEPQSNGFEALLASSSQANTNCTDAAPGTPSISTIAELSTCPIETRNGHEESRVDSKSLTSHGPQFTKVDRNGLTADAKSTADWEHKNFVSTQRNSRPDTQHRQSENNASASSLLRPPTAASCDIQRLPNFDDLLSFAATQVPVPALQRFPLNFAATKSTMKQHAKNKSKSKIQQSKGNASAKKTIVTLPLPDPIPTKRRSAPAAKIGLEPCKRQLSSREQYKLAHVSESPTSQVGSPVFLEMVQRRAQHKSRGQTIRDGDDDDDVGESDVPTTEDMKVTADIGTLLILRSSNADQLFQADASTKLATLLTHDEQIQGTLLLTRITTSSVDVELLFEMLPPSFKLARKETLYEFRLHTTNGGIEKIVFDPAAASADRKYHRSRPVQDLGIQYLHFADRIWDARIRVATRATNHVFSPELDEAILEFLRSLNTDGSPPSITGAFDLGLFTPEEVRAKRIVTYTDAETSFIVTEVQVLEPATRVNQSFNFRAQGLPRQQMISDQRIWIEARFETDNLKQLPTLQEHLKSLVMSMDDIGASNRGPSRFETT